MVSNIRQKSTAINALDAIVLLSVGTLVGYVYARCQAMPHPSPPTTANQQTPLQVISAQAQDTDETNEPLIRKLRTHLSARNSHYQIDLILPSDERLLSLNAKKLLSTLDRALGSTNPNEGFSSLRHITFNIMPPYLQQLMPRVVTRTTELDLQIHLSSLIRDEIYSKESTWESIFQNIPCIESRPNAPVTYDLSTTNSTKTCITQKIVSGPSPTPTDCQSARNWLGMTCFIAPFAPLFPAWLKATAFMSFPWVMDYERTKYEAMETGKNPEHESAVEEEEKMIQIALSTLQPPETRSWLKRSTIDRIWTPQRDKNDHLPGAPLLKTIHVNCSNSQDRTKSLQKLAQAKTAYIRQEIKKTASTTTYGPSLYHRVGIFPFVTMKLLP